jgi:heme/copper-type cytochrome/quinol oxidase subunit 4
VQALAPSLGALLLEHRGADTTLATLTALALVNVVLVGALWWLCRAKR